MERLVKSGLGSENILDYTKNLKELAEDVERARDEIRRMSRVFKALSHPTRLKILKILNARDMCVCEVMTVLNATQSTTSHHLNILENMGLIKERRGGKWVFYGISDSKMLKNMIEQIYHKC
ncbi:MAG: metalloregulator ArsR/SmtB family transcription factor [Nitrososphaerota archaeon]